MALVTLDEVRSVVGTTEPDTVVMDRLAAVSAMIERYCNRAFPRIVSIAEVTETGDVSLLIPRHGIPVGSTVRVASSDPDTLGGDYVTVSGGDEHRIIIPVDGVTENDLEGLSISVRKRIEITKRTRGGQWIFIDPRPVVEIDYLAIGNGYGEWEEIPEANYSLSELQDGESISGEIYLSSRLFPMGANGKWAEHGAKIRFYAGSEWVQPDLAKACLSSIKAIERQQKRAGFSSERYDYYSYTRFSGEQLKKLFGEVEHTLASYRLTPV